MNLDRPRPLSAAVLWSLFTLLAFLCTEAAIFRSGWYNRFLKPDSTGKVELRLFWFTHAPPSQRPEVLVVGDSRIAAGFSAPLADGQTGGRLHFWNFGIAGTTPRDWYYLLRDAAPPKRPLAAIVLALDQYSDVDYNVLLRDRIADIHYSIGRLRLADCRDFAMSFSDAQDERTALTACVFKGSFFRADLLDFLAHPRRRLKATRGEMEHGLERNDAYTGRTENLHGLWADLDRGEIHYPPGLNNVQRETIRNIALPQIHPDTGASTQYRQLWLGRILDLYRDSPTRVIFLQLPRSALSLPDRKEPRRFLQSVAARLRISILPDGTFQDLEQPDLFADGVHLNSDGRKIFTTRLADHVAVVLGARWASIH